MAGDTPTLVRPVYTPPRPPLHVLQRREHVCGIQKNEHTYLLSFARQGDAALHRDMLWDNFLTTGQYPESVLSASSTIGLHRSCTRLPICANDQDSIDIISYDYLDLRAMCLRTFLSLVIVNYILYLPDKIRYYCNAKDIDVGLLKSAQYLDLKYNGDL